MSDDPEWLDAAIDAAVDSEATWTRELAATHIRAALPVIRAGLADELEDRGWPTAAQIVRRKL